MDSVIFICAKYAKTRRACRWAGRESELVQKPHPKLREATQGHCPVCDSTAFFVRPLDDKAALKKEESK